ncbi:MAG: hypothetical protein IJ418_09255 [Clostridia bacterium]|nr:hypothetical protein [Clostridia bacterium]
MSADNKKHRKEIPLGLSILKGVPACGAHPQNGKQIYSGNWQSGLLQRS